MNQEPEFIHIITVIAFSFLNVNLLLIRNKSWFPESAKWILTIIILLYGILGLVLGWEITSNYKLFFAGFFTPIIVNSLDFTLKRVSFRFQNRSYYLRVNNQNRVNSIQDSSPPLKFTMMDDIFSFFIIMVAASTIGIIFLIYHFL